MGTTARDVGCGHRDQLTGWWSIDQTPQPTDKTETRLGIVNLTTTAAATKLGLIKTNLVGPRELITTWFLWMRAIQCGVRSQLWAGKLTVKNFFFFGWNFGELSWLRWIVVLGWLSLQIDQLRGELDSTTLGLTWGVLCKQMGVRAVASSSRHPTQMRESWNKCLLGCGVSFWKKWCSSPESWNVVNLVTHRTCTIWLR